MFFAPVKQEQKQAAESVYRDEGHVQKPAVGVCVVYDKFQAFLVQPAYKSPCGELDLPDGVIIAARHVHLSNEQAAEAGLKDKDVVKVWCPGERALMFENVLVRVSDSFLAEMHVDIDEGNAASLSNGQMVQLIY